MDDSDISISPILEISSSDDIIREENVSTMKSQQSMSLSQSQQNYSGLLSSPDFDQVNQKIYRDVEISTSFQPYTLGDFLSYGAKIRPAKRTHRKGNLIFSRQSRTFQTRLKEYRPIIQTKISELPEWQNVQFFPDIISISSMSPTNSLDDENKANKKFAWDTKQAIGFQEFDEPIVLIGHIIKISLDDPGIVMRQCSELGVIPLPSKPRHKNLLFLEDHTAKIRIGISRNQNVLSFHEIVSGVPLAIRGTCSGGKLWVEDVLFATPPSPEWPIISKQDAVEMVFVSGLHIGSPDYDSVTLSLLLDYLQGLSGSVVEQDKIMRPKTRVFIVGNSLCVGKRWNPDFGERMTKSLCENLIKIDNYFENLAQTMEVFVIPGENDPICQGILPQPPFHKQILPLASQRPTFHALTNPAKINLSLSIPEESTNEEMCEDQLLPNNLINLVLTSRTNVKETMQCCEIECPLEMSAKLLEWSHIHPTSVADSEIAEEIFNLKESLPHLFIVGGLADFKVKEWNGVKIVGVPSFAKTGTVMVLTRDCDVLPLSFKFAI